MKVALLAAAGLLLGLPVAAQAHPPGYYQDQLDHLRDHAEHADVHDQFEEAHARAHAEGFSSEGEHQAYHQGLEQLHDEFHQDHPGVWHDHWDQGGYASYAAPSYYYGSNGYSAPRAYYVERSYRVRPRHHRRAYSYYGW